jgi:hypothetical protein
MAEYDMTPERQECCLCLRRGVDMFPPERLKQYGTYWSCKSCLAAAVSVAYFAACRLGYAKETRQATIARQEGE